MRALSISNYRHRKIQEKFKKFETLKYSKRKDQKEKREEEEWRGGNNTVVCDDATMQQIKKNTDAIKVRK